MLQIFSLRAGDSFPDVAAPRFGSAPRLAMRSPSQPSQIDDHRDQQPHEIDSRRRHAAIKLPRVDDCRKRQENEPEYRKQESTVKCTLKVS